MSETPPGEERDREPFASESGGERDDPFEELDDFEGTGEDLDGVFEEMEVPEIDEEEVWDVLFSERDPTAEGAHPERVGANPDPDAADGADAVVEKDRYCLRCEHFSEPPDVACSNPETEIVELVGVDRFRVRNCPVAAHRQRAEAVLPDQE